jgi:N-hydroxyarylamine O-acetyltransferase
MSVSGYPGLHDPVALETDVPTIHGGRIFRLADASHFGLMLQTLRYGGWQNLYSFDLGYVCQADIDFGNHFTSTHPRSFFTSSCMAVLPNAHGAKTLFNHTFTRIIGDNEYPEELPAGELYLAALKMHFGIDLDAAEISRLP